MRISVFVLVATSSMCFCAQARLIDDFTQGSLNISAGPLQTVTDVENGLDPTKVIGGGTPHHGSGRRLHSHQRSGSYPCSRGDIRSGNS